MRISTSQLYNVNVNTMSRQQSDLMHLQQQLSLGKKVVQPSDDPVASARALDINHAIAQTDQQLNNQGTANDALKTLESKLASIGELIIYSRDRVIQAGNGALNADDRKAIAADMRAQFDSLMGVANSTDSNGEYVFSGFKGDTVPFSGNLQGGVTYQGDQGQRALQVTNTRIMPTSQNGDEVFMRIPNLNGQFNTRPGASNSGGAVINDGQVTGAYANGQYGIRFTGPAAYAIYDRSVDPTMSGAPLGVGVYTAGTPIDVPPAPGAQIQVTVSGTPTTGDTFTMDPGGTTDIFNVLQQFVLALENSTGNAYEEAVVEALGRLDNGLENALKLRAQVGSRQVELDALTNVSQDLNLQYADRLDKLVGLDYTEAISDFQLQQTYLEAARQTFSRVTGMTLFDFIN